MYGIHVCMYGIHACMYVCMFGTSERVCLNGGSDSLRKAFGIERFMQFFEFCEGGTSTLLKYMLFECHTYMYDTLGGFIHVCMAFTYHTRGFPKRPRKPSGKINATQGVFVSDRPSLQERQVPHKGFS